ncbi:hypothetical protein BVY01_02185 [bacterium I07]|nr:hypothetical protein BVY01_02185 [bacterium I07]
MEAGTVKIIGTSKTKKIHEVTRLLIDKDVYNEMANTQNPYGDGKAAVRISNILKEKLKSNGF